LHLTHAIFLFAAAAIVDDLQATSWTAVAVCSFLELLVAIYGGYFGAGIGFITLGMLTALGMRDIHGMGAIRTLLAATINAAAVLTFILARAVLWPQCVVMIAGALTGSGLERIMRRKPILEKYELS